MNKIKIKLSCPCCDTPVNARLNNANQLFILFLCPNCRHNIVVYDGKIRTISEKLLQKLIQQKKLKKLRACGFIDKEPGITKSDINYIKQALKESPTVEDFLQKI